MKTKLKYEIKQTLQEKLQNIHDLSGKFGDAGALMRCQLREVGAEIKEYPDECFFGAGRGYNDMKGYHYRNARLVSNEDLPEALENAKSALVALKNGAQLDFSRCFWSFSDLRPSA